MATQKQNELCKCGDPDCKNPNAVAVANKHGMASIESLMNDIRTMRTESGAILTEFDIALLGFYKGTHEAYHTAATQGGSHVTSEELTNAAALFATMLQGHARRCVAKGAGEKEPLGKDDDPFVCPECQMKQEPFSRFLSAGSMLFLITAAADAIGRGVRKGILTKNQKQMNDSTQALTALLISMPYSARKMVMAEIGKAMNFDIVIACNHREGAAQADFAQRAGKDINSVHFKAGETLVADGPEGTVIH